MEQLRSNLLPISHSTLPTRRADSSVTRALAARLTVSEAIDLVGKMIRGFSHQGQAGKSYIGAIAEILMQYPKQVAIACADPIRG